MIKHPTLPIHQVGFLAVLTFCSTGLCQELIHSFQAEIQPILETYCFDCHANGASEGNVILDEFTADSIKDYDLWLRVLKNMRANIMPPQDMWQPSDNEREKLSQWIKHEAFAIDPKHVNPGKQTIRRLNRTEYQNTIFDLLGVRFETTVEFPADNTGEGFDNIGELLTLSPMMLEKYLDAANRVITQAVPTRPPSQDAESPNQPVLRKKYERFFSKGVPHKGPARQAYTRNLLTKFASLAFRRPVDDKTVDRLIDLAQSVSRQEGNTYEMGISQAMVAILASPRFLFREEFSVEATNSARYPLVDEYSLASRLSYFLWSTMPDEELFDLANSGQLRVNLDYQIERMIGDKRFDEFLKNFAGQWLRTREIESVSISTSDVLLREKADPRLAKARKKYDAIRMISEDQRTPKQKRNYIRNRDILRNASIAASKKLRYGQLKPPMLRAMRRETEMYFAHVIREDRSLRELLDSDYTFLNQSLAEHYQIEGVSGPKLRKVKLEANSPRGGILTQATLLAVTSNPTRTSPVKRGVFILENILGTPPAAPPPNIPSLEDVASDQHLKLSLRESLARHRQDELCASCHNRMDPLGLALENFNAMGIWRDSELNQPIDVSGKLISGEEFSSVQEMKQILATDRIEDFYTCFSEKLLIYSLGRGLDYYDIETIDQLVETLMKTDGSPSSLIKEVIKSAPFQKCRSRKN